MSGTASPRRYVPEPRNGSHASTFGVLPVLTEHGLEGDAHSQRVLTKREEISGSDPILYSARGGRFLMSEVPL